MSNCKEISSAPFFKFRMEIYGPDGKLRTVDEARNTVVTVGKNYLNDTGFRQGTGANLFIAIKGTGTAALGDTMASHTGWAETTAYTGNRLTATMAAAVGGTSTVTPGTFAMTGTYTAAGAFITTGTVPAGTVGTLYSAGDFGVTRTGGTGDTLVITPTLVTA